MNRTTTLHFFGGAGTVTGSNFLLDTGSSKILIDCGLFQSAHACEETNWSVFPYDPKSIQFLIVTHVHIDHIGRIPRLVREGFRGRIISTEATRTLAEPLLLDSLEILASEARRCNREPLYDEEDVMGAMKLWEGVPYHQTVPLADELSLELLDAGHILGSAMAKLTRGERGIVFTGDLGGGNSPLLPPCESPTGIQYLVMESVYGNKMRKERGQRREALEDVIEDTVARGGVLLIPAFSTERTQDLIFEIRTLMVEKRVPSLPVYIDSPLAQKITEAFLQHPRYFVSSIRDRIEKGENIFSFPEARFTEDIAASKKADETTGPKIIIAGSGMSNGGRVRRHEMQILPDPKSTLLIVGFQVAGSLGRRLVEGAKNVTIQGNNISVRCKVESLYSYSAHMDGEALLEFVSKIGRGLEQVFVVHGEPIASSTLTQRIRDYLGIRATAPEAGEKATLEL